MFSIAETGEHPDGVDDLKEIKESHDEGGEDKTKSNKGSPKGSKDPLD